MGPVAASDTKSNVDYIFKVEVILMIDTLVTPSSGRITMRHPTAKDGAGVAALISSSPPLDINSTYCVLLQCTHFAQTCILAERDGQLMGWISGYAPPTHTDSLFVWQVAVAEQARGTGLASRMLDALVARPALSGLNTLRTTITADNAASWRLFESFAQRHGGEISRLPLFEQDAHFAGQHATEFEFVIRLKADADQA